MQGCTGCNIFHDGIEMLEGGQHVTERTLDD